MIRSHLSYTHTLKAGSKEIASDVLHGRYDASLVLLPETPYEPRFVDSRMSVFPTGKILFSEREQQAKLLCYANRWRVELSDEAAYRRGELVRPKKPIVFYIDPDFPRAGASPFSRPSSSGTSRSNASDSNRPSRPVSFRRTTRSSTPTTSNIRASAMRPSASPTLWGPRGSIRRSGEIVNASVYVFHDIVKLVNNWRFIQTAQADKSVRGVKLPREVMDDALRYVVTHEVGYCLGFMHNMSASAVIPVDSLRSPSFTQKYGTTTSIMDYARFNYVAQPGTWSGRADDASPLRRLRLLRCQMALYAGLRRRIARGGLQDHVAVDHQAAADPVLATAAAGAVLDPRSQTEDLGDDAVKASSTASATCATSSPI